MHTKESPFACTYEGCNKKFCDREGLIQHEDSHIRKGLQTCCYKSCNQTFSKPFQLHCHYREEHEKTITPAEEIRPIRLRLSQPKRPNPASLEDGKRKRLLIRLPITKTLGGTSTSAPTEANEDCSESKTCAKWSTNRMEGKSSHRNARPPNSSSSISSTSETSGKYQVSSDGSKIAPIAIPQILTPNVRPLAPAPQPSVNARSAENNDCRPYTNGRSGGYGTSGYTRVCGAYSREIASPVKKIKRTGGRYRCPRCDTPFTRARAVMNHFVGCIAKYGNPDSLKWTDHPSLQRTVKLNAHKGHQGQEDGFSLQAANVGRIEKRRRELSKDSLLRDLVRRPLSPVVKSNTGSVRPVYKPLGRDALLQQDLVRPIHKRQDAVRRSTYRLETIARDVLLAMGSHPSMDPLNAHLDTLRKRFGNVGLESNMSTFRWDLVDPQPELGLEPKPEPGRQIERQVEPEQSAPKPSEAEGNTMRCKSSNVQRHHAVPSSLPSRSSTNQNTLHNEVSFDVSLPEMTHFGLMSTVYSDGFDRDSSARLMPDGDLWTAIFTMLECRYDKQNFVIRAAVSKNTGDVIGWVACHEVDTPQAKPVDPSVYLDWTTAAHLLPSQISRFTATKQSAEEKSERWNKRMIGQGLASTIQARATEAQLYLVPIRRLVINALVVHPLHQGHGVASELLKSITEVADRKKIPVWVQTPEDPAIAQGVLKVELFRRAGFMCAGELNLDLDVYTSGPQERDETGTTLGTYKWNYMLRWPQLIVPKTN